MRIYLVRHAKQTSILCNDNSPLDNIGIEQAQLLGKRLKNYNIDAMYSSDLIRAVQTAEIIQEEIGNNQLSCIQREGLRETDFGVLTMMTDDSIKEKYHDFMESRYYVKDDWAYPGGESGYEVWIRAKRVLDDIVKQNHKNVVVVTHGGTIRVLLAGLFQGSQKDRLLFAKTFERGSFTELYYDTENGRFYLERLNDFAHLEGNPKLMMRKEQ